MARLLPYYERELGYLRRHLRDFAERYPKIAGRLLINGEGCADPYVAHMIQACALLNARMAKRLDDDYPEFTWARFDVLYPHYMRPLPSCSIARFELNDASKQQPGDACIFRTVYPGSVTPLAIAGLRFTPILQAPEAVLLPEGGTPASA